MKLVGLCATYTLPLLPGKPIPQPPSRLIHNISRTLNLASECHAGALNAGLGVFLAGIVSWDTVVSELPRGVGAGVGGDHCVELLAELHGGLLGTGETH